MCEIVIINLEAALGHLIYSHDYCSHQIWASNSAQQMQDSWIRHVKHLFESGYCRPFALYGPKAPNWITNESLRFMTYDLTVVIPDVVSIKGQFYYFHFFIFPLKHFEILLPYRALVQELIVRKFRYKLLFLISSSLKMSPTKKHVREVVFST